MVLVWKRPFWQLFFIGNIGQENVFYDVLERKNGFLGYKHKKLKKSKNWDFSIRVNPRFWSKNGHFSNFFLKQKIGQENVFYDILQRSNYFLGYKNKKFKESKDWDFSKGVNAWFWSKNFRFFTFFLLLKNDRPGKCSLCYSKTKKRLSRL